MHAFIIHHSSFILRPSSLPETPLPIKWIAARVLIGTPKGAKAVLHRLASGKAVRPNEPHAHLQFQSTG